MFTGIISEVGRVIKAAAKDGSVIFTIEAPETAAALAVGDSVAVQGVCQTVIACEGRQFTVQAVEETLRKTTLGSFTRGTRVNMELPLRFSDRLGGHLVQGHVDCVGRVAGLDEEESSRLVTFEFPSEFRKYVIPVGSIAVDGISLTVARTSGSRFTVAIIPHTLERTTMAEAKPGTRVNLEFDIVGKYLEKLVTGGKEAVPAQVTEEKLKKWGYRT